MREEVFIATDFVETKLVSHFWKLSLLNTRALHDRHCSLEHLAGRENTLETFILSLLLSISFYLSLFWSKKRIVLRVPFNAAYVTHWNTRTMEGIYLLKDIGSHSDSIFVNGLFMH